MQRLILGAGKHWVKEKGDTFVDIRNFDNVDTIWDLNITPWPFPDSAYDHVSACHLVEHLKDLISFMDECHRVLTPGGSLYLTTPLAGVNPDLEFSDPTHVRCYRVHTFVNYFSLEGIQQFGYTDKAWNFFVLRVCNDILEVHAYPIKK